MALLFLFLLGTIIGSALTAILSRLPTEESWVHGRSKCPRCAKVLSAIELVPLLSWFVQRGRCRGCQATIGAFYPIMEFATGLLFVIAFVARFGFHADLLILASDQNAFLLLRDLFAIAILEIVFVFDLLYELILDEVTIPAFVILGVSSVLLGMPWQQMALGAVIGAGFFGLQFLVSRGKWIGGGDVRLGAVMGALLGWQALLVALLVAYVSGAIIGGVLILTGARSMKSHVPFGTFLSAATVFALYCGQPIATWYASML